MMYTLYARSVDMQRHTLDDDPSSLSPLRACHHRALDHISSFHPPTRNQYLRRNHTCGSQLRASHGEAAPCPVPWRRRAAPPQQTMPLGGQIHARSSSSTRGGLVEMDAMIRSRNCRNGITSWIPD